MSGFLYYLPGKETPKLDDARAVGLAYAFEGEFKFRGCHSGPDGTIGAVCAVTTEGLGYYPDRQTWRQIPGSPVWLGYVKDAPPPPEDLARTEQLSGHRVKLGDGKAWLCPVARGVADNGDWVGHYLALPAKVTLSDSGEWTIGEVEERYRELWSLALSFWDVFSGSVKGDDSPVSFDFAGSLDAAVTCLQANYRIGRTEAAALGLFDHQAVKAGLVLQALVDWPSWDLLLKKRLLQAALSPTDAGQPEGTPAIVPA